MKTYNKKLTFLLCAIMALTMQPYAMAATSSKKDIKKLLAKRNILATPSLSSQVTTVTVNFSGVKSSKVSSKATAPTLKSIPDSSIKDLFWRKIDGVNVIDSLNTGNPSQEVCKEFYSGTSDGQSGGLGSCHLAESVGYAYSTIVNSGISSCFIKTFPTKSVQKSGSITVNSGSFPENNIEKLFSSPSGSTARIVKINLGGEFEDNESPRQIFVQIPTTSQNSDAKNIYSANLWYCNPSNSSVTGYDTIKISNSLQFSVEHADQVLLGKSIINATGFLVKKGNNLIWNAEKSRTASTLSSRGEDDRFRSEIEITKNSQIKLKRLDNKNGRDGRGFLFTEYSGNTAENLRFMLGAFNELHREEPIISASDFNGTFYATDTESTLLNTVSAVDLNDDFYNQGLDVNVDFSPYSCTTTPDIELTIDANNQSIKDIMSDCAPIRPDEMRFCHEDPEIIQAEIVFRNKCTPPPTPTPRPTKPAGPPPKP